MALTGFEVHEILVSIERTALAAVIANVLIIPIAIGCGMARMSRFWILRFSVGLYIEVFRGTSALVQLFFAFYVLPVLGWRLDPIPAGIAVLTLNGAAFASEAARGALLAVPIGQSEAAAALNLGWWTTRFKIVLPQAWRVMLPPLGNVAVDILKGTSLLSMVAIPEVTSTVLNLSETGGLTPNTAFIGLLVVYLVLSGPVAGAFALLERRSKRSDRAGKR